MFYFFKWLVFNMKEMVILCISLKEIHVTKEEEEATASAISNKWVKEKKNTMRL